MKKFNWKKIVTPIAMLVIGLLGGLLGAFILLTAAGVSFTNTTDTGVKTAKTVYSNTTDTTKAVKKVQNAVVSVINYQEGSSSDSLNDRNNGILYFLNGLSCICCIVVYGLSCFNTCIC